MECAYLSSTHELIYLVEQARSTREADGVHIGWCFGASAAQALGGASRSNEVVYCCKPLFRQDGRFARRVARFPKSAGPKLARRRVVERG